MTRFLSLLTALGLLLAACGDDDTETTTTTSTAPVDSSTTSGDPGGTSSSTTPTDPSELPGEAIEIFPYEGNELAVVGVAHDDTLNVRSGPGVSFDVLYELDPTATGIDPTGHNRSLDGGGIWAEITSDGETGWANVAFLAHLGGTDDVTTELYATPADRPTAETMLALAETVGSDRAPESAELTVVVAPTVGDLGEIVIDMLGYQDDAVRGERLHIFADIDGESFTVRNVESTVICGRGTTDDGLCV